MIRTSIAPLIGFLLMVIGAPVLGCGQLAPSEATEPGGRTILRGYGYGYEGGHRPVTLVWSADGTVAASGEIDVNGEFQIPVTVPMATGLHRLVVKQGEDDAAPMEFTVPVFLPAPNKGPVEWMKEAVSNYAAQWGLGILGLALLAAMLVGGIRGPRQPSTST